MTNAEKLESIEDILASLDGDVSSFEYTWFEMGYDGTEGGGKWRAVLGLGFGGPDFKVHGTLEHVLEVVERELRTGKNKNVEIKPHG